MNILNILIKRDNMTEESALELIKQAKEAYYEYIDNNDQERAYYICGEFFGLEPDYLIEFINFEI